MNRRQFLQRLGIIAAGAVLVPTDQQLKRFWQLDQTMVRRQPIGYVVGYGISPDDYLERLSTVHFVDDSGNVWAQAGLSGFWQSTEDRRQIKRTNELGNGILCTTASEWFDGKIISLEVNGEKRI